MNFVHFGHGLASKPLYHSPVRNINHHYHKDSSVVGVVQAHMPEAVIDIDASSFGGGLIFYNGDVCHWNVKIPDTGDKPLYNVRLNPVLEMSTNQVPIGIKVSNLSKSCLILTAPSSSLDVTRAHRKHVHDVDAYAIQKRKEKWFFCEFPRRFDFFLFSEFPEFPQRQFYNFLLVFIGLMTMR